MLFGIYSENPNPFEKDMLDELLYWVVRNENFRRNTGSYYRIFSFFAKDIIQVNMNPFFYDYLQKFVIPYHNKYMVSLIKKIEPVVFKVIHKYGLTEYNVQFDFHIKTKTYFKEVKYSSTSRIF